MRKEAPVRLFFPVFLQAWCLIGFTFSVAAQCELESLVSADAGAGEEFGFAVSLHGDVVVVGARLDDDGGQNSGSVYTYRYRPEGWTAEQKVTAGDGAANDWFGHSVATNGGVIVAGARHHGNRGSVYVYQHSGGLWRETDKLAASDAAIGDLFGGSIAISGGVVAVGATGDDDAGSNSGAAYVYRYDGTSWQEDPKVTAGDASFEDRFGSAVDVDGATLLVGAERDDALGSAYVYRYDGVAWIEEQKLSPRDGAPAITGVPPSFGHSVSVSGDWAVIGAPRDDAACGGCPPGEEACCDSGAVYVFRYRGGGWAQEQKLIATDAAIDDRFGSTVAVSGDRITVGAAGATAGAVYVFRYDGNSWVQGEKLTGAGLGQSLRVVNDVAVAGGAGFARLYALGGSDCDGNGNVDLCDIGSGDLVDQNANFVPDGCELSLRGDSNGDGRVSGLVDALFLLSYQFIPGTPAPTCLDAADVDDNGMVNGIGDGLYLLNYFFLPGSPPPPNPGPSSCGVDSTPDALQCDRHPCF